MKTPAPMPAPRTMSLTAQHVALSLRDEPDLGPEPGWRQMDEGAIEALSRQYHEDLGSDPLWVFAYGSLIWKPDFDAVDHCRASAYGWHRSFCLKMHHWRGSPQQLGLMMALERGGRCDGVIYRVREGDRLAQIRRMVTREIRYHENIDMMRWIPVHTARGRMRALVFWAGPSGERILSKLPLHEVAHILARACGSAGSCAEYLFNTVLHLQEFGIRDRNLWTLQKLVAQEIDQLHGHPRDLAAERKGAAG
ncbi:gamma-glutamylcyclotransferase [Paracoccus broussonetiae]|uniref:glutathione-specific gamma-glutamylcyclotransferase n=1 Tax=Paracoccus broussonetiae subsp. drimophilus TaxID=3373869 RepID=A0ABW7LM58_9RHOB